MAGAVAIPAANAALSAYQAANLFGSIIDAWKRIAPYAKAHREKRGKLAASIKDHIKRSATKKVRASSSSATMPRTARSGSRAYKRKRAVSTAKRATRKKKVAKKKRNYKYLSKIPVPIQGLTTRKVARYVCTDNFFMNVSPSDTGLQGDLINTLGDPKSQPLYHTFCMNDMQNWRPYFYLPDEGGVSTHDAEGGFVPGWDTWKDKYKTSEVIGAKITLHWTNVLKQSNSNESSCYVGYNITHDRRDRVKGPELAGLPGSVPPVLPDPATFTEHPFKKQIDALNATDRALMTSEDLIRSKLFTLRNIKTEAPGDRCFQKTGFNVKTAYPPQNGFQFQTSAPLIAPFQVGNPNPPAPANAPGRTLNKSYMTVVVCPTANSGTAAVECRMEMELIVVHSDLIQTMKSTKQVVGEAFQREN